MKLVINNCFGGFGLSHEAVMLYGTKKGIPLFPFVEEGPYGRESKFKPYDSNSKPYIIHYSTQPLTEDGQYQEDSYFSDGDIPRDDPYLIQVIEELGDKANGSCADLGIIEIPDDIQWEISEYDGNETVEEKHRSWS